MNEIITITHTIPLFISSLSMTFCLVILFLGWQDSIEQGDPIGAFVSTSISVIICIFIGFIPTKTHKQYLDITKYQVTQTDRFIKLYEPNSTKEILTTTDYYTISNFKDFNAVSHTWNTNIYGLNTIEHKLELVKVKK